MPAPRHPTHAQYHHQEQPALFSGSKSKGAQHYQQPADGLAISYEQNHEPLYLADQSEQAVGWQQQDDLPIPRNVTKGGFLAAYDPETDTSNRVDSVFDAYAEMYADMDDEDEDEHPEEEHHLEQEYDSTSQQDPQPPLEDYSSQPQAREPWDQRGKNGLYGGGGRGADDRETGWVSNYGIGGRAAGVEEDLRYEEEQAGRTERLESRDTYRGGERRSSSGTEHSSYGPVTPTNASFSGPGGPPQIANNESGYRHGQSPPSTQEIKPSSKLSFANTPPPPMPQHAQSPTSPSTLKKKSPPPKASPSGLVIPIVNPMQHVDTSLLNTTRRKTTFKWSRSKKAPVISKPILPDGFVESLGMDTFALTPGCSAPNHLLHHSTTASTSSADHTSDHASSASSIKSASTKEKDQNRAPRPRKIPNRPNFLPSLKLGAPDLNVPISHPDGTSSLPRPTESPLPTPVRLPLNALRHSSGDEHNSSDYSHEISDAFRRLSRDSEVSYAPSSKTIASAEKTRRLYFNGIREERARQADQEVQANRAPVLANAPAIPAVPSRYQDEVESPLASQSTTRHGSADSAFRNPWGPTSGARQSGGSFHSSNNGRLVGGTPQGFNAEPRGSISSHRTINQRPSSGYRPKSFTRPASSLHAPVLEASESQDSSSYSPPAEREDRQGSTSSAYSELSNINDYLSSSSSPSSNSDIYSSYTSPPPTQPLRRQSVAPPPPTTTAPLNLGRRQQKEEVVGPSAMGTTGPTGGFNNWGHREEGTAFGAYGAREPNIIGGTGFRNPFG